MATKSPVVVAGLGRCGLLGAPTGTLSGNKLAAASSQLLMTVRYGVGSVNDSRYAVVVKRISPFCGCPCEPPY